MSSYTYRNVFLLSIWVEKTSTITNQVKPIQISTQISLREHWFHISYHYIIDSIDNTLDSRSFHVPPRRFQYSDPVARKTFKTRNSRQRERKDGRIIKRESTRYPINYWIMIYLYQRLSIEWGHGPSLGGYNICFDKINNVSILKKR